MDKTMKKRAMPHIFEDVSIVHSIFHELKYMFFSRVNGTK
jgi:hypothetical protein